MSDIWFLAILIALAVNTLIIVARLDSIITLLKKIELQQGQPTFHWSTTTTQPDDDPVLVTTPSPSSKSVTVKAKSKAT